jgi:hypothetical protein
MALTRDFKETIQARVKRDPAFRKALLREGIESFLSGDVETGKTVLRDFINATIGFTKLGRVTRRSPKSLMRMLGPTGNPHVKNLFEIVAFLQQHERVRFKVRFNSAAPNKAFERLRSTLPSWPRWHAGIRSTVKVQTGCTRRRPLRRSNSRKKWRNT